MLAKVLRHRRQHVGLNRTLELADSGHLNLHTEQIERILEVHHIHRRRAQVEAAHVGHQDAIALGRDLVPADAGALQIAGDLLAGAADARDGTLNLPLLRQVEASASRQIEQDLLAGGRRQLIDHIEELEERFRRATAAGQHAHRAETNLGEVCVRTRRTQQRDLLWLGRRGLLGLNGNG